MTNYEKEDLIKLLAMMLEDFTGIKNEDSYDKISEVIEIIKKYEP